MEKSNKAAGNNTQVSGAMGVANAIPPQVFLYLIGVPLAIGASYFILIKPLLKKFGGQTEDSKAADDLNAKLKGQPYWSGSYYLSYGGDTIKTHEAAEFATRLHNCMHGWFDGLIFGWGTDETCIFGIFGLLGSKGNISLVSQQYSLMFQRSLFSDMEDEMSSEELAQVAQKISLYAI